MIGRATTFAACRMPMISRIPPIASDLVLQLLADRVHPVAGSDEGHGEQHERREDQVVRDVGEDEVALPGPRVGAEHVGRIGAAEAFDERPSPTASATSTMFVISSMTHHGMMDLPLLIESRECERERDVGDDERADQPAEAASRKRRRARASSSVRVTRGEQIRVLVRRTHARRRTLDEPALERRTCRLIARASIRSSAAIARLKVRLHRVRRDRSVDSDLVDRQLLEVPQRDAVALTGRQVAHRIEHAPMILRAHESIRRHRHPRRSRAVRRVVAEGDHPASVVVTGEVEHDRAQIRRRLVGVVDPPGVPGEPQERLLDDVLGRIAVVDEQPGEPDERCTLGVEEPDDQLLGSRC